MKQKFTGLEKIGLGMAALFIIVGMDMLVNPKEEAVYHPGVDGNGVHTRPYTVHISKKEARIYGGIVFVFGAGLGWLILVSHRE